MIEDLQSISSPEKEKRFLESNKDMRNAEELYKQAIEIAKQVSLIEDEGKHNQATYNTANAYNKLGYHYRLAGNWDKALDALGECLPLLDLLYPSELVSMEKASVSLHFGIVHMARYRQSGNDADWRTAQAFLKDSIERASSQGHDTDSIQKLLDSL